jgi:hypothetical protein
MSLTKTDAGTENRHSEHYFRDQKAESSTVRNLGLVLPSARATYTAGSLRDEIAVNTVYLPSGDQMVADLWY